MNTSDSFNWTAFHKFPVVGILRGFDTPTVESIGQYSFEAGLTHLEVTLNTNDALTQIERLRALAPAGTHIGAGTVISMKGLNEAISAGAEFVVSPVVDIEIIQAARSRDIPVFPGAYTPSEVLQAWNAGASLVKLFPSNAGGPAYLHAVKAPLDHVKLMAVGSVNLGNVRAYLSAGADAIGLGSPLFDRQKMLEADWTWLQSQIRRFRDIFGA